MAPINLPDGTEVSEIVLPDGSTASKVLAPDGSTVFSAIPDSGLSHHYDATQLSYNDGDTVNSWDDLQGGSNLSADGSPTYKANSINGNPAVDMEGLNGDRFTNFASDLSQPYSIYGVLRYDGGGDRNNHWVDGNILIALTSNNTEFGPNAGNWLRSPPVDQNPQIYGNILNGSNSENRRSGVSEATGDAGTSSIGSGATLGDTTGNEFGGQIGEVLVYNEALSNTKISEVEFYLSDKWGITI